MIRWVILSVFCGLSLSAMAFWPFDDGEQEPPRLSELMETASGLIDEASDLSADDKINEAVAKYREALKELNKVEAENPERAETPEFATLRTKRAYVTAAIDSLLLNQVKDNAKAVAVSDTTELEKRLQEERRIKEQKVARLRGNKVEKATSSPSKRIRAMQAISNGDFAAATILINQLLEANPDNIGLLNMKAIKEVAEGDIKAAELTLSEAIRLNPQSYQAYYNMAKLIIENNGSNKAGARRYYETGRAMGGPKDPQLEAQFK